MITRLLMAATLALGSSLAFAQVCSTVPGSVCLVPSPNAASTVTTYTMAYPTVSTTAVVPYSGAVTGTQMVMVPATGVTMIGMMPACPANISTDTACLVNQIAALRSEMRAMQGTVRAAAITSRGQQLISRMHALMAEEAMFRQQVAANPNLPGAQGMALQLSAQTETLNRDIADFNRELSMIPMDQRPLMAADLTTFTTAYWNPAQVRFAEYRTNVGQAGTAYQPAYAANPWLQPWLVTYQNNLSNIAGDQQQYASVNWWTNMQVAGTTEVFPGGTMVTPSGAVIYIPAGSILAPMNTTTTTTTTTATTPAPAQ